MQMLSEVEKKQRTIGIYNDFTFEYTVDLSGDILVYPPFEYSESELCSSISQLICMFMITTFPKLDSFIGIHNINFKIIKHEK